MQQPRIYMDYAAATPMRDEVLEAMKPFWQERFYNPSSLYESARQVKQAYEAARQNVAETLGAKKSEIIFTAGGTESINLALFGVARQSEAGHIVTTAIEHEAILACLPTLVKGGWPATVAPVLPNGLVNVAELAAAITDQTSLITVMYANNEIGTIQPIGEISQLVQHCRQDRQRRGIDRPIYLHTDASQAAGYLNLQVSRLGIDLMTLNGGKIYGPKQSGCLYVRTGVQLAPLLYGGGQEKGLRSGTQNVAAAVGLATALRLAQAERETEVQRLTPMRDRCLAQLKTLLPGLMVNGDTKHRLPNNINVSLPGLDGETAVLYLDQAGIQAGTGSACTAGNGQPSHVLAALGRTLAQANGSLRFTLGRYTSDHDIDHLVSTLPAVVKQLPAE